MNLFQKIMALYPSLTPQDFINGLVVLQNDSDGKGDYIKVWNHPMLTRPTQTQLDEVTE
jgi:hypothetical protein